MIPDVPRTYALSIHADYRCAHSGACCTAGWAIPVEPARREALGADVLMPGEDGSCRFFDRETHLCRIHRDRGEAALPDSCRHFPRVALVDDRGVHITLSHFCPTAASLLFRDDVPLKIVASPRAFPDNRGYEGLDARGEWPPLVTSTLLFDREGYDAWESFVVRAFAIGPAMTALARIARAAEQVRRWTPVHGPMRSTIDSCDAIATTTNGELDRYGHIAEAALDIVTNAIPEPVKTASLIVPLGVHMPSSVPKVRLEMAVCRYLAAKAFASWTAYQSRGVRTLVAELVLAHALVRRLTADRPLIEAIREADRLLVHLADRQRILEHLAQVEDAH